MRIFLRGTAERHYVEAGAVFKKEIVSGRMQMPLDPVPDEVVQLDLTEEFKEDGLVKTRRVRVHFKVLRVETL